MRISCDWVGLAVFATCVALALAAAPLALSAEDAASEPERALLDLMRRAFERTFEQPGVRSVGLRVERGGRVVSRRAFDVAYRRDGELGRALVRFTAPEYLRGHALLIVDRNGKNDTWLYQPAERRPRRVGTAQKGDSFYGSDISFEDLEQPHWEGWRLAALGGGVEAGRECQLIEATPQVESQYGRLVAWIDRERLGVARVDFFRAGAAEPFKRLRTALGNAGEERGFLRIGGMEVEQIGRNARTVVEVARMEIDPDLAARVFSAMRLERAGEDLFDLAGRTRGEAPR